MFTSKCHLCRPNGNGMVAVKTTCNRLWGAILCVFKESVVNFTGCLYLTALWVTKIHDVYNITIAMNWPWLQDKDAVETTASQEHAYPCPLKPLLLQRGLQGSTFKGPDADIEMLWNLLPRMSPLVTQEALLTPDLFCLQPLVPALFHCHCRQCYKCTLTLIHRSSACHLPANSSYHKTDTK